MNHDLNDLQGTPAEWIGQLSEALETVEQELADIRQDESVSEIRRDQLIDEKRSRLHELAGSTVGLVDRALAQSTPAAETDRPDEPADPNDPLHQLLAAAGRIEKRLARAEARGRVADQVQQLSPEQLLEQYAEAVQAADRLQATAYERVLDGWVRRHAPQLLPRYAELKSASPTAATEAQRQTRKELHQFTRWALSRAAELGLTEVYRSLHGRYESMVAE